MNQFRVGLELQDSAVGKPKSDKLVLAENQPAEGSIFDL